MPQILEGLCTTRNADASVNVAPLGAIIEGDFQRFVLRPFPTSVTYRNIKRSGHGVFHVTDDAALICLTAVDYPQATPPLAEIDGFPVPRLQDCCRWFAWQVDRLDESGDRPRFTCLPIRGGEVRPFWGFNRARHALIELAIVASRVGIIPNEQVERQLDALAGPITKTASSDDLRTWKILVRVIRQRMRDLAPPADAAERGPAVRNLRL